MTDDRDQEGLGQPYSAGHPSGGKLSLYHARKLSLEEEERVREHLVGCQRCQDLLLEYADFMGEEEEERKEGVAGFRAVAEWKRLKERLGEGEEGVVVFSSQGKKDHFRLRRSLRAYQGLAALLAFLLISGFLYTLNLKVKYSSPHPVMEKTLSFAATLSSEEVKEPEVVRLPATLRLLTDSDHTQYRVEIFREDGQRIYSKDGYPKNQFGEVLVGLPKGALSPGIYEMRLSGLALGKASPVGGPKALKIGT